MATKEWSDEDEKYLVIRRDGTVPEWNWFVLGSQDPAALRALREYADEAERLGFDKDYVKKVRARIADFRDDGVRLGKKDPDELHDVPDDVSTVRRLLASGRT